MITFDEIPGLDKELQKVNKHIENFCHSNSDSMQKVLDWVLLSRGKQIRPILTLLFSKLKGKKADATEAAAIVEMCHTASLIHDDIIDNADLRRGKLSVQKKFGRAMAVYAGDFMIFSTINRTDLMDKDWYRKMFSKLERMCYGEVSQYDNTFNTDITEEDSIDNMLGKTSALFEIACYAGAFEGGCNIFEQKAAVDYAKNLGIIFQLRDDLLDFVVSNDDSGKTIHNDFQSGYYTIPAIHTFSHPVYGSELKKIALDYKNGTANDDATEKISNLIQSADGFNYTISLIEKHTADAIDNLSIFKDSICKQKLIELVNSLCESSKKLNLNA